MLEADTKLGVRIDEGYGMRDGGAFHGAFELHAEDLVVVSELAGCHSDQGEQPFGEDVKKHSVRWEEELIVDNDDVVEVLVQNITQRRRLEGLDDQTEELLIVGVVTYACDGLESIIRTNSPRHLDH